MTATKRTASQFGNATLLAIAAMGFLSTMAYIVPSMLNNQKRKIAFDERVIHGTQLAGDLKELGKYFLLYEKIVFKDNPLMVSAARSNQMQAIWQQTFGNVDITNAGMLNACGGYDAVAKYVGDLKVGGQPVFCPYYVRNTLMDGQTLEDMVLNKWNQGDTVVQVLQASADGLPMMAQGRMATIVRGGDGKYTVELDLTASLDSDALNFVLLNFNPDFLDLLKSLGSRLFIRYEFYTDSSGFKTKGSARNVKVSGVVAIRESRNDTHFREIIDHDSMVISSPTIKDFAVFMPYPVINTYNLNEFYPLKGTTTDRPVPTRLMSQAINWGGATSQVFGRVFFNGDIDTPLASLPVFHEAVMISGNFTYRIGPAERAILRTKFRKGIITNFPVNRFVFDGPASPGDRICTRTSANLDLSNVQGLHCRIEMADSSCAAGSPNDKCKTPAVDIRGDFGMIEYIIGLNSACSKSIVNVNTSLQPTTPDRTNWSYAFPDPDAPAPGGSPMISCPSNSLFVRGGTARINVSAPFAYLASPTVILNITASPSDIYGVAFAGGIIARPGTTFYSLARMRVGTAGIGSEAVLNNLSEEASLISEGVGIAITVPLVETAREAL